MRMLLLLLGLLLIPGVSVAQMKGCDDCPLPPLDPIPKAGVVQARLDKIEKFVKAGDLDTALGLLQNLSVRYPTTKEFHERALEITLEKKADSMTTQIAEDLLARDPGNPKALAAQAAVRARALASSSPVTDLAYFEKLALGVEIDERGIKILRALQRYNTRKGQSARLGLENSRADVWNLYRLDFLDRPYDCPVPDCVYLTSEDGRSIRASKEEELALPRPKKPPLPDRRILEAALRSGSPVTRKHARRLLLRSKLPASVLEAAAVQSADDLAVYEVVEVVEDLNFAVYVQNRLGKGGVPHTSVLAGIFGGYLSYNDPEVRLHAAYGLALLGEQPRLPKEDVQLLFSKFSDSRPGQDPDFLAALLGQYPTLLSHVVRRIKAGKHSQPQQVLFRSLARTRDLRVLRFLVACLAEDKFLQSYVAILETLKTLTGKAYEQPGEWEAYLEKGGGFLE